MAVTAHAVREEIELCYTVGMDGHLIKPYREEDLAAVISQWLPDGAVAGA